MLCYTQNILLHSFVYTVSFLVLLFTNITCNGLWMRFSVEENAESDSGGASSIVNITECSVPRLTLKLTKLPNLQSYYTFIAVCNMRNGTCFYGEEPLGVGVLPTVGSTYTVDVHPSCTQNDKLSPGEMEICTLVISSLNLRYHTSGTATTVCTLPTLSSPLSTSSSLPEVSTSLHSEVNQPSSSVVNPTSPGTGEPLSTPVIAASIAVPLFLLIMVLTVAIVSFLMWMRPWLI